MKNRFIQKLLPKSKRQSLLRTILSGSLYKLSDMRGNSSISDIKTQIDTMRALARDSQISTALSYYATDATLPNTAGQIIWATATEEKYKEVADIVNSLFKRWKVNTYAREHILELATIGNLYIPTNLMYGDDTTSLNRTRVVLDNNTIPDSDFDIVPSTKIPPEDIIHLWYRGQPSGFIYKPSDDNTSSDVTIVPEDGVIHFSLGGLLGDYTFDVVEKSGDIKTYDILFAEPLMSKAVQPTQTLSLLEDANVLASMNRIIKFINVNCGDVEEETEIQSALQQIKDTIEQQLSLNTLSGDCQSYVNPQSPNNLIYLPKINGEDPVSITDLNMVESSESDNNLLKYYQDKKLSVLGVPKEAMNFSSNEGLGGAGSVLSQRSALYANSLQRIETAYMAGWTDAINAYFRQRNMSGFIDTFQLHMQPIITTQSTITFDKRDAAIGQATNIVTMLKDIGVNNAEDYKLAITEILSEVLPQTGSAVNKWHMSVNTEETNDI